MVNYLRREFLQIDYHYQYEYDSIGKEKSYIFENIRSIKDYWKWLEQIFTKKYCKTTWRDNKNEKSQILANNRTNKIIGLPMLRQLRVKNGKYFVV
jgi:hypothetical protein